MLTQQIQRVRTLWNKLSQNQKIGVLFVGMSVIIAVGLMLLLRPPQHYDTAFSGLASDDASAIVDQLRSSGIPYQLSSDGTTIRVPSANVADVRLTAAASGLPKGGGVGFELFDKSSFGITEFAQQVNYQRALAGELQRTIDKIDAVASSKVNIVIPQQSLFTSDEQPTTAAVVIQFKPGGQLTQSQIKGVSHLVASSVPGLKPENLTILDTSGTPIWSGDEENNSLAGAGDNFQLQQAYENDMSRELEGLLGQVVGAGQAAVKVSAVLNFDQKTTDSETYSPDGTQPQIRSQQETTQSNTGSTGSDASGVPGTDSNTDSTSYAAGTPTSGSDQSQTHDVTTNYELSRTVEHTVQAPGQVQRLSVAVVLNQTNVDPVVTQQIQSVIASAAGIDPNRGDAITVTAVPFKGADTTVAKSSGGGLLGKVLPPLKILGIILVPLVAIFFARKQLLAPKGELRPALASPTLFPQAAPNAAQMTRRMSMSDVPLTQQQPPVAAPVRQLSTAQAEVTALAEQDPAQLATLIRLWMNEDK